MSDVAQTQTQKPAGAIHLTTDDFEKTLAEAGDKPVFVDFYAEWCGPCKLAGPVVDKLAVEYADKVVVAKVDTDENNELARQFGVMSIPTTILFKRDGDQAKEIDRKIGFPGEQVYRQMLDKALGKAA